MAWILGSHALSQKSGVSRKARCEQALGGILAMSASGCFPPLMETSSLLFKSKERASLRTKLRK